ncbi:MAG: hypothetical protein QOK12_1239 [Mycobacterium sp.]|jgi:hypothetical protein|nr:hypothetical protein [Mycobacterium sp.]
MNTRRITLALGAAAGGMLASAFLSSGLASALPSPNDVLDLFGASATGSTVGPETIDASNGILPFFQDTSGYQEFNIYDTTVGTPAVPDVVGTDDFLRSDWTSGSLSNTQYTLDATEFGGGGMVFTGVPDPGSVYDTLNLGGGLENVYSDVLTGTGTSITSTVTDHLLFNGTELLNLSSLVSGLGLDFAVPATDAFLSF